MPGVFSNGVPIHYELIGWDAPPSAEPPLLLHTGAGGDRRMWHDAWYVAGLEPRRLILMDHRGHGESGRPTAVEEHRIERYLADIYNVLDAEEVERVAFLGYSDGGALGFAFAAALPERCAGLVSIGAIGSEDEPWSERRALAAEIRSFGIDGLLAELARNEPGEFPGWVDASMRSTDPEMFALELEGWADWSGPWSVLGSIAAPVLMVVGELEEGEPGLAPTHAAQAAQRLQRGNALAVTGLGHLGVFVRSERSLTPIRAFLDDLD